MTNMTYSDVVEWLDSHPENTEEYFLKRVELDLVNKWLVNHGFLSINDYVYSRRSSDDMSNKSTPITSPVQKNLDLLPSELDGYPHQRSNSRKHLRQDFARSKTKSVFLTASEPVSAMIKPNTNSSSRRSSLKGLRKYVSLPPSSTTMLSLLIESKVQLPEWHGKDRESKARLRQADEREFFLDIVKDIANDLDLRSMTQKITENLSILLDGDGASLFLVEGRPGSKTLISKVFDIHTGTNILPTSTSDNCVQVPWGKGFIGFVAETGRTVNIVDPSKDERYNDEVDRITGYRTDSLLCMPVRTSDDEIIAVAQVVNKNPSVGNSFSKNDEKLLETYLQFCSIAITNAKIFETSRIEYKRNRDLLEVVHDLFEEQTSLDKVVLKIMQRAQNLLKCERALVLLLQENSEIVKFSKIFDFTHLAIKQLNGSSKDWNEIQNAGSLIDLAEQIVLSGEVINIPEYFSIGKRKKCSVRSVLGMPIRNHEYKIIGVAEIINKVDGCPFNELDEQLFEAFTIFCGLGINNTLMYSELDKALAKQKVAIEVLHYHTSATHNDVENILNQGVLEASKWSLNDLQFDDFSLNDDKMLLASIRMFLDLGLLKAFSIEYEVLTRWLVTVKKNYRNIPYHNWRHAFNVGQFMFAILRSSKKMNKLFTDLEKLAMLVGCLSHDLDHRGENNAYQVKSGSPLAMLYGTKATMEQHHFNHAVMILTSQGLNIFSNIPSENYSKVMHYLKYTILATDLLQYFQTKEKFSKLIENGNSDWSGMEERELLMGMLMTACDIAASTKPFHVQQRVAELVTSEFFDQGDKEKTKLKIKPQALMDRERKDELPRLQITWIEEICLPLYETLSKVDELFEKMVEGAQLNSQKWSELAEQVKPID